MAKTETIFLGSHLSLSSPDYYLGTVRKALDLGENCFMFYTGAPQNTVRLPLERMRIEEGRSLLKEAGLDESKIVVHAPYIINLGNKDNENVYSLGKSFLVEELKRASSFGACLLVLHPGSSIDLGEEEGIRSIYEALNYVLERDGTNVRILLETMAGKGSERGSSFIELSKIYEGVKKKERVGFCLDSCHVNDAGYDLSRLDSLLSKFDEALGLNNLGAIHLNDSKNAQGSHKDRHENIGYGTIGFDILEKIAKDPRLLSVPKILETPMFGDKYPYKKEIEMLRSGIYEPGWREAL